MMHGAQNRHFLHSYCFWIYFCAKVAGPMYTIQIEWWFASDIITCFCTPISNSLPNLFLLLHYQCDLPWFFVSFTHEELIEENVPACDFFTSWHNIPFFLIMIVTQMRNLCLLCHPYGIPWTFCWFQASRIDIAWFISMLGSKENIPTSDILTEYLFLWLSFLLFSQNVIFDVINMINKNLFSAL